MKTRKLGLSNLGSNRKSGGFSLIELMIVIGIVALLVALALPSYREFIRKSNRGEAQQLLMNWANLQEIWRSNHTTYAIISNNPALGIAAPTHDLYTFTMPAAPTATTYTLQAATTDSDQVKDKDQGQNCATMTVNQTNTKTHVLCW